MIDAGKCFVRHTFLRSDKSGPPCLANKLMFFNILGVQRER